MSENEQTVVLVADDEPSTLALVTAHVRSKGFKVIEASDGDMAWQLAHQHLPHLVILDVMMPGMSGWEVCRKIRESLPLAHTGVIMLTGIGENLNEMTSPLYGADAHVDKPFEFSELDEKIQETLANRRDGAFGRTDGGDEEDEVDEEDEFDEELAEALPADAMEDEEDEDDEDLDFADDEAELPLDSLLPPPKPAKKAAAKKVVAKKAAAKAPAKPVKQVAAKVAKKASKKAAAKVAKKAPAKAAKKASKKAAAKVVKKASKKAPAKAAKKASKKATAKVSKKVSKQVAKKAPAKSAKKAAKKASKKKARK